MRVPVGYTRLARGAHRAVVRDDLVCTLGAWLLDLPSDPPGGADRMATGRGAAFRLTLPDGTRGVVRLGRRGGLLGRIVTHWYLGRPRPWRELRTAVEARRRAAPVPEVLGCAVAGWGAYRSAVVTAEVPRAVPVLDALRGAAAPARDAIAREAGTTVARLHRAGIDHKDLNLTNVLIGSDGGAIVDLDGARHARTGTGRRARRRSLARLRRSAGKLDPHGEVVDDAVVRAFHAAYTETWRA